jgi:hypothetical protein
VPPGPDSYGAGRGGLHLARGVRSHRRAALALLVLTAALVSLAVPSTAWAVTAGSASIVQPGSLNTLDSGGAQTSYGVALPPSASCPGDTAHQGYHVYSYLVPAGHTPTEVNFKHGIPNRWYGFFSYGAYYGAADTAEGTGQVMSLPPFSWTRYSTYPDLIFPDGKSRTTWEGGIACTTTDGVVTNYWNAQIVFTKSATTPGGFTWKVIANPPVPSSHLWLTVGIVLVVVAVVFAVVAIVLGRRRNETDDGVAGSGDPPQSPGGRHVSRVSVSSAAPVEDGASEESSPVGVGGGRPETAGDGEPGADR